MICESCKQGGTENLELHFELAEEFHSNCKGDCGCQHQTGPGTGSLGKSMAEPMRTQFPLE